MILKIGDREIEIEPRRTLPRVIRGWRTTLARGEKVRPRSPRPRTCYVHVEIEAVHDCDCAATYNGQRFGPCNCGAVELIHALAAEDGAPVQSEAHPVYAAHLRREAERAAAGGAS